MIVTLSEVRFSPSMIRRMMYLRIDDAAAPVWTAVIESVRVVGDHNLGDPLPEEIPVDDGSDDPNEPPAATQGPWTLTFTVP